MRRTELQLRYQIANPDAQPPSYATPGAACFDLSTVQQGWVGGGKSMIFATGLKFEVPEGHVMLVFSRSGHGFKNGVRLANCVGVIDSDYRGEVMVKLQNDAAHGFAVAKGDRIAQAMVLPVQQVAFSVVEELSSTERGEGGFGSTGNKALAEV